MRFMIMVKANKNSEAGVMPEEKLIAAMAKYHEELAKAGVLLDASGLQPTSKGWRIKYSGGKHTVVDGPFAESKELIAGYTLIQVKSREEALEWAKRFPSPFGPKRRERSRFVSCSSWMTSLPATRWTAFAKSQPQAKNSGWDK